MGTYNLKGAGRHPVTILIGQGLDRTVNKNQFSLATAAKFIDESRGHVNIFDRIQVETLKMFSDRVYPSVNFNSQSWEKEISFVLLQLTSGLKYLQAQVETVVGKSCVLADRLY